MTLPRFLLAAWSGVCLAAIIVGAHAGGKSLVDFFVVGATGLLCAVGALLPKEERS